MATGVVKEVVMMAAGCRMTCGGGITKLLALLIIQISNRDLAPTTIVEEAKGREITGTTTTRETKIAEVTTRNLTSKSTIHWKMVSNAETTDNEVDTNKETALIMRVDTNNTLEEATRKEKVATVKLDTSSTPEVATRREMVTKRRVDTSSTLAEVISKETVRTRDTRRAATQEKTTMVSSKFVVVGETTMVGDNSVGARDPTLQSKVTVKLVISTGKKTDKLGVNPKSQ